MRWLLASFLTSATIPNLIVVGLKCQYKLHEEALFFEKPLHKTQLNFCLYQPNSVLIDTPPTLLDICCKNASLMFLLRSPSENKSNEH